MKRSRYSIDVLTVKSTRSIIFPKLEKLLLAGVIRTMDTGELYKRFLFI